MPMMKLGHARGPYDTAGVKTALMYLNDFLLEDLVMQWPVVVPSILQLILRIKKKLRSLTEL